jgi:hypothetical protein
MFCMSCLASIQISSHRLLCHSLVRSELYCPVKPQRLNATYDAQRCDPLCLCVVVVQKT